MDKILGFLPDAESTIPGVLTSVTNMIPVDKGMAGAPSMVTTAGVPALAAACRGAAVVTKLDDVRRVFAGTTTKLYELSAGAWADVSRAAPYTTGVEGRWSITQFGDSTLASNLTDTIQRSNGTGAFADIAGAPKAKIIFSVGTQVMALNVNDGAVKTDGWHACASFDETDWVPNVATLCTSGRLVSTPGAITAGGRMGEYAVVYKEKAIYLGQFVDAPVVWDFTQVVGGDAGCVGQDAWCDINGAHFIVGIDSMYIFDGTRPQPVGMGEVRDFFYTDSSPSLRYKTQCLYDKQTQRVWIHYVSANGSALDSVLIYHVGKKRWGHMAASVQSVLNYVGSGVTIDGLSAVSATIDGLNMYSFDSQFWRSGGRFVAAFNASNQLQSFTGSSATSGMVTGDAGDDDVYSLLTKVRLRFDGGRKPTSASVQIYGKDGVGDPLIAGPSDVMHDGGRFDVLSSARFHRGVFTFAGDHVVTHLGAALIPEGDV